MFKVSKRCKSCGKMKKHGKGARVCMECRKTEIELASVRNLQPIKGERNWKTLWLTRKPITIRAQGRGGQWYECELLTFDGRNFYYKFPYGQIVRAA